MGNLARRSAPIVADGDPDGAPRRLGSALPAAKSADRVLNSADASSKLRAPAAGTTKGWHSRSPEAKGAGRKQGADRGERPGTFMSCRAKPRE